jgi:hypothetical protein
VHRGYVDGTQRAQNVRHALAPFLLGDIRVLGTTGQRACNTRQLFREHAVVCLGASCMGAQGGTRHDGMRRIRLLLLLSR